MIHAFRQEWETNGLRALLKPAVVLAVLALAYLLGRQATPRLAQLAVLAVGGGLAFLVLTRRPEWGLLALIPASFLVPWEIGTGTQTSLNAAILWLAFLLGVWALRMVVIDQEVRLVPSRVNLPALAFALSATISLVAGNLRWLSFAQPASLPAQLGGWAIHVLPMGLLLLVGNQVRDQRGLRALTWLFLGLGGLYMAGCVIPGLGWVSGQLFVHGSAGAMFWTWLVALACGQCLLNRELDFRWRLLLGLLTTATLYVGWFQNRAWASGWLPPLVALVTIVWLRSWRVGLALTIVGVVVVFALNPAVLAQATADNQYSIDSRQAAWEILAEIIKANPLLGLGPSNYYHYTPLYSIWGWHVQFNSHNQYMDIIAQVGLVGLGLFVWLIAELGRLGWRLRTRVQSGFGQGYVYGALGGLVGTLVAGMLADWFLPFVYNIGIAGFRAALFAWLFLGGLVTLEQMANGK